MIGKKYIAIIRVILPVILFIHLSSVFAFTHVHAVDGGMVVHSHPFHKTGNSNPGHTHTTAELEIIYVLSAIQATTQIVFSIVVGLIGLHLIQLILTPVGIIFSNHTNKGQLYLRPPPSLCA